jgi:AcrR family transcriptional regulator
MSEKKGERRRGDVLEDAILDATWSELVEHGYNSLTMEAVARRAGTSRPVLHRRWSSRSELAAAAMSRYVAQNPIGVPDLGSVREEVTLLLRRFADRAPPELMRFIFDMRDELIETKSTPAAMAEKVGERDLVQRIVERGVVRGEIDPSRLTPRAISLPLDLVRHEMLMTLKPLPDSAIREIVDDIFLPLICPLQASSTGQVRSRQGKALPAEEKHPRTKQGG